MLNHGVMYNQFMFEFLIMGDVLDAVASNFKMFY
jgi:hypothetical protein